MADRSLLFPGSADDLEFEATDEHQRGTGTSLINNRDDDDDAGNALRDFASLTSSQSFRECLQFDPAICDRNSERYFLNVRSDAFNGIVGLVIIVNALIIGLETEYGEKGYIFFEHFFAVFFILEMACRINQLGFRGYVNEGTNLFDAFLVISSTFDLYVLPLIMNGNGSAGSWIKMLRMFRIMRIVRLFKMFHSLEIILNAFINALSVVGWVGLLTLILNYICAIFLTQTVGHADVDWGEDQDKVYLWFGTLGNSFQTLLIVITLQDWDDMAMTVSKQYNGYVVWALAFSYIILTAYTMLSLITGCISEALITAQMQDDRDRLAKIEGSKKAFGQSLRDVLSKFDEDDSGSLTHKEIEEVLTSPGNNLMNQLAALNIDMDMSELLYFIDRLNPSGDEDADIKINDIADVMSHFNGPAKACAIWELKFMLNELHSEHLSTVTKLRDRVMHTEKEFARYTNRVEEKLSILSKTLLGDSEAGNST